MAAGASLGLAISLTVLKALAVIATGSLTLLTSLIDSISDITASAITFWSVRVSTRPPDADHRFGHGKAESLSALAQSGIVTGSALLVVIEAGRRLWQPVSVEQTAIGLLVMGVAMLATLALVFFQKWVVRVTGSQAIAADSMHYQADIAMNLLVVASLLMAGFDSHWWVDPILACAIACYLLARAISIGREAVKTLMDHELPQAARDRIKAIVRAHPAIEDLHDLRTRQAGSTVFIEFHVELDGSLALRQVHEIVDGIERSLIDAHPGAEIIVHQEPAGIDDARLDHVVHRSHP